jgi:vancomycin permeability regulator SanA
LQLLFLYFIKYFNQDLPINEFSLNNIGNIFNLLVYCGIFSGKYFTSKKKRTQKPEKSFFIYITLTWLLLIISFLSTKIRIIPASIYLYNQPGDKVLTGFLFLLFLFMLLYLLISVWNGIIFKKKISVIRNIFSTALMMFLFLLFTFFYIGEKNYSSSKQVFSKNSKNVAVVLCAAVWTGNIPSPTLSLRVDKALDLLKNGKVDKVVLTGGSAPGELSESEVAYEYAKVKGVDTSRVIIEKTTSSTTDQIKWIRNNLFPNNAKNNKIVIVSDGYHLPRAIEISKFFNIDVRAAQSNHKLEFNDKLFTMIRESIALFIFWNFAL